MVNKIHYKNAEKLFGFTRQTWAKWQAEERAITKLLNYFDDTDIIEFLETGKIEKLEELENSNYLKDRSFNFYLQLQKKLPKATTSIILNFLNQYLKENNKAISIEDLVQYIYTMDDDYFKVHIVSQEDLKKLRYNSKHKAKIPTPAGVKLLVVNEFQKLDSFIFEYFCSHVRIMLELEKEREEKLKDSLINSKYNKAKYLMDVVEAENNNKS
ncbi:MAG: hypothetical protein M0R77_19445 [Gammaproteobacteria bacterium]|nr:hypothetical protein [Gammaproteobacteria bacterium]